MFFYAQNGRVPSSFVYLRPYTHYLKNPEENLKEIQISLPGFDITAAALYSLIIKGIVHFEIKIWYVSAYPKGIQDVGVFFSSVDPILMFLGQTVLVCQSYNGRYRSLSLWEGKRTCTEKFKLNNSPS